MIRACLIFIAINYQHPNLITLKSPKLQVKNLSFKQLSIETSFPENFVYVCLFVHKIGEGKKKKNNTNFYSLQSLTFEIFILIHHNSGRGGFWVLSDLVPGPHIVMNS